MANPSMKDLVLGKQTNGQNAIIQLDLYEAAVVNGVFRWCLAILIAFGYGCGARSSPAAAKRCVEGAGLEGAPHP